MIKSAGSNCLRPQTILGGRFAIRVCITNHRSELSDFDALVEAVLALGAEITEQGTARAAASGR